MLKRTPLKRTGFKNTSTRAKNDPRQSEDLGDGITVVSFKKARKSQPETSKVKKPKVKTTAKLKKELWDLCKLITRKRHKHCYTCPKQNLEGSDAHTGHGKPKGALPLRYQYDLRNLKLQCMHDNINLGGCSDIFIAKLEQEEEGLAFLQESCRKVDGVWIIQKNDLMSGRDAREFVKAKIEEYKLLL